MTRFNHTDLPGERCQCKGHPAECWDHPEGCGCNMSPEQTYAENALENQQNANMTDREQALVGVLAELLEGVGQYLDPNGSTLEWWVSQIIAADPWTKFAKDMESIATDAAQMTYNLQAEVERLRGAIAKAVKRANGNGMGNWKEFRELNKAISDPVANAPT